jgi:hypothetical protein
MQATPARRPAWSWWPCPTEPAGTWLCWLPLCTPGPRRGVCGRTKRSSPCHGRRDSVNTCPPRGSTDSGVLYQFGATTADVFSTGQLWRLIAGCFVHIGLVHIMGNSMALLSAIAQSVHQVDRSMRVAESSESGVTEFGVAPTTPTDGDSTPDTDAQVESSAGNAGEATPCRWCGTAVGKNLPRFAALARVLRRVPAPVRPRDGGAARPGYDRVHVAKGCAVAVCLRRRGAGATQ